MRDYSPLPDDEAFVRGVEQYWKRPMLREPKSGGYDLCKPSERIPYFDPIADVRQL